jgi:glycosyltransferase involved in cell wall biosynthesis
MKILIISIFFPPRNSIASMRPYSWAKYWSRAGHEIVVLTIPKDEKPSDSLMDFSGFRVMEVPVPGIKLIRYFESGGKGLCSSSKGADAYLGSRLSAIIIRKLHSLVRILQHRYGIISGIRMPDPMEFWGEAAFRAVNHEAWDLVVSTAGPYYVHIPAYRLRRAGLAIRWIADWRDLWVDNHMFPGWPIFKWIEGRRERDWCELADYISTVSPPLADILGTKYQCKVAVIYNGFDPEEYINLPRENVFDDSSIFRIIYTGTIYQGKQDPSPLFEAVKKLAAAGIVTPDKLKIMFCGSNADVTELAKSHGISSYVEYLGFVPRARALQLQQAADALLLLEVESEKARGILTGKLFEYLYAGPPILAIGVGADSAVGEILYQTGRGKAFGRDHERLARELQDMIDDASLKSVRKGDLSVISQYTREAQADALLRLVKQA